IEKEVEAVNRLGGKAEFVKETPLPLSVAGAVKFERQAQFHPLKFIARLADGLKIYENTFIRRIEGRTAFTEHAKISAERIVIATHFPFFKVAGGYFVKMYQHRSYAVALAGAQDAAGMWVDEKPDGLSFRNYQDLLLVGGGDHRTGKKGGGWQELRRFAKQAYPAAEERFHWATQDCMTLDSVPYIGSLAASLPRFYVATGFNKWGMTSSMLSGMLLADMLSGQKNEFAGLFSPRRFTPNKQFFLNGLEAAANLLKPSGRRCTHLGCALKWNGAQCSWDCPCHGSRFDEEGRLLENPAVKKAKV
ncbi:MAG: FAD-dependent oxidoreductase, partial [Clostridiales bacterium]|nr:FAD-dependent oxidoreductase [Clostridiales bacterium]